MMNQLQERRRNIPHQTAGNTTKLARGCVLERARLVSIPGTVCRLSLHPLFSLQLLEMSSLDAGSPNLPDPGTTPRLISNFHPRAAEVVVVCKTGVGTLTFVPNPKMNTEDVLSSEPMPDTPEYLFERTMFARHRERALKVCEKVLSTAAWSTPLLLLALRQPHGASERRRKYVTLLSKKSFEQHLVHLCKNCA